MLTIRRSAERGHLNFGWLDTYHTFSFGDYWDRRWMGFGHLRVINQDRIAPAQGFGTHPHRDMEIITYVLSGALEHRDSMGTGSVIHAGDVQRMSAGTGITHSEFNALKDQECHLLQIWLLPEATGITPEYDQKSFDEAEKLNRLRPVVSNDGRDGSMTIHQQAVMYASILDADRSIEYKCRENAIYWLQLITGEVTVGGEKLHPGDGCGIQRLEGFKIEAEAKAEFLLFEMW
jgi:redox-sensitive bicupin YhaK (pirin superfamily)